MERADLFVHHTPSVGQHDLNMFARLGAILVRIEPFGSGAAAYCNKIRQLDTPELENYDYTILSDTDLLFLSCPTRLASGTTVKAKPVDLPNPPEHIWRQLLVGAGIQGGIETVSLPLEPANQTFATNCNGGLYVLPKAALADLRNQWAKWARYCLDKQSLLDNWHMHCDQLGFGLALIKTGWPIEHLAIGENFPSHLSHAHYAHLEAAPIHALHYHRNLDVRGQIKSVNIDWIDSYITKANATLSTCRSRDLEGASCGDFRHLSASEFDNNLGTDNGMRHLKLSSLLPLMRAISQDQILDVGGGIIRVMPTTPLVNYSGINLPSAATEIVRNADLNSRIEAVNISEIGAETFDWTICLDISDRQSLPDQLNALFADLVRVGRKGVLFSNFGEAQPGTTTRFASQELANAFRNQEGVRDVIEVGAYQDVTLYLALKTPALPLSSHDASLTDIAFGCGEIADWPLLLELVNLSRAKLGFYPKTIIRTIEYPWFAHRLDTGSPSRLLDLGAGVSALPLWLAQRKNVVVTVDNHPLHRLPDDKTDWNEWGYLDYSKLDSRITSLNINAKDYAPDEQFDVIYSVSVIEHMPANIRRAIIKKFPDWLAPGGRIFLSLDLIPGTSELWPLSGGQKVDSDGEHGTMDDLLAEMTNAGLRIVETSLRRSIAGSRTDLAFVEATLPVRPKQT
jgi:hypothetical protein